MSRDNLLVARSFQYTVRVHVLRLKVLWFSLSTNRRRHREEDGVCAHGTSVTVSKVINLEVVFGFGTSSDELTNRFLLIKLHEKSLS